MVYIIINTLILALLSWGLYIKSDHSVIHRYFWPLLLIKCLAGIAVGLMFTYYYSGGDTFFFLEKSGMLAELAQADVKAYLTYWISSDPEIVDLGFTWSPNIFFVKIVSLFDLLTGHNYWLISLYFSLLSFSGLWYLAVLLVNRWSKNPLAVLLALFCVPTVLFWSSGLTKESLVLALISVIAALFLEHYFEVKKITILSVVKIAIALFLLWEIRYYYAGILLVMLIATVITWSVDRYLKKDHIGWKVIVFCLTAGLVFFIVSHFHPNFYLSRLLQVIVENHDTIVAQSNPESIIAFSDLEPKVLSVIKNIPKALFSGLFRPAPGENLTIIYLLPGIESMVLIVLTLWFLFVRKKCRESKLLVLGIAVVLYAVILAIFLSLSAPNFGALVRYRVGFMPFLYLLFMMDNPWLKKRSSRMF